MEAVVLAGGLGTRLRGVIDTLPKCMAPVAGQPFLYYVLTYLADNGVSSVIFSLGYKHEVVEKWVLQHQWPFKIQFTVEESPLGTGGAIKAALHCATESQVIVINGDTFFNVDIAELYTYHASKQADISIALKPMQAFDRYGTILIDETGRIRLFQEKMKCEKGLINGGVYLINRNTALLDAYDGAFSFETEVLQPNVDSARFFGYIAEGYFIDIGIPDDYLKAGIDATSNKLLFSRPDQKSRKMALFLDRDGVINKHLPDDYVKNWNEFVFLPGVLDALCLLAKLNVPIFVVTNQRGVGKGLMRVEDLEYIHHKMVEAVMQAGGRIDRVYSCTDTHPDSPNRKPNSGMALQAQKDFPEISLNASIMIGDSDIDMEFGQRLGMRTVLIGAEEESESLLAFAKELSKKLFEPVE